MRFASWFRGFIKIVRCEIIHQPEMSSFETFESIHSVGGSFHSIVGRGDAVAKTNYHASAARRGVQS